MDVDTPTATSPTLSLTSPSTPPSSPNGERIYFDEESHHQLVDYLSMMQITDLRTQCQRLGLAGAGQRTKKNDLVNQLACHLLSFNDPDAQHPGLRGRLLEPIERWLGYCALDH